MGITEFIDEIKSNPLLIAIGMIVIVVGVYFLHKNTASPTAATTTATVTDPNALPPVTYNQSFNSYPQTAAPSPVTPVITPKPVPTPIPTPKPKPVITPKPKPLPKPVPAPKPTAKYVTVTPDTATHNSQYGTLWGIAKASNISLVKVEALNSGIKDPNLIYTGQKIRIA
jgi:outer membrane biosynthesis protein TonB